MLKKIALSTEYKHYALGINKSAGRSPLLTSTRRLLEKERNVDDTFAYHLIRPIGSVAGELIWPRSYDSSNELTFDENGAAFPLHERPTLSRILRRSRISSLNANTAYKDSYNYNNFYNNFS
ncbi:hypothetical protein OSTOST_23140 [Ostertagia ostertagi]